MSNLLVSDVVGTGVFAIPATTGQLNSCNSGLAAALATVPGLNFERAIALVKDSGSPGWIEGARTLNCLIAGVRYNLEECPDETECDALFAAIEAALEFCIFPPGSAISSIGLQEFNIVDYIP